MAKRDGALTRFFRGAGYLGRGFSFVRQHRALWPWVAAPSLLTGLVTVLGAFGAHHWARAFIDRHTAGHGAIWTAILTFLMYVFVAGVAYVAFLVTSMVATAPFAGTLSEKAEKLARGDAPTQHGFGPVVREAVRSTLHTIVSLTLYLTLAVLLFLLQFFASVLAPLIWVASLALSGTFLAYDAFDPPLSRRDAGFGRKWAYVGEHAAEALGFGVVVALLIAVPLVNLFVPAVAAVGGTLLFLDLERS